MQLQAPAGTRVYNVWIWLVVFLPYVTLVFLPFFNWGDILSGADYENLNGSTPSTETQLRLLTSPAYLASVVIGFVALGVNVISGYRDHKLLRDAGMPRPFHWAWNFFQLGGYPVYPIGRAIVTLRRTGKGLVVMWATIGMIVLSFIIVIVFAASILATVVQQLPTIRNGF